METYEIDPAFQPFEEAYQGIRVAFVVVETVEHCVLEAHPALAAEIVAAYEFQHIFQRESLLHGHHLQSLVRERVVEADRQVAALLIEILLQLRNHAYGAEGDALGTPGKAPGAVRTSITLLTAS